jgi:hypothetical protein
VDGVGRRESLEHQGHGEEVRRSLNGRIATQDRLSPEGGRNGSCGADSTVEKSSPETGADGRQSG